MTPSIATHMNAAITAVVLGPFVLWARLGRTTHPRLHRAFVSLLQCNVQGYRKSMQWLFISACLVAGAFTLLPGRYLGQLIWSHWLGLI